MRDVYLVTASEKKLPVSTVDPLAGGGGFTSPSYVGFMEAGGRRSPPVEKVHSIDALVDIGLGAATVDEFCKLLEGELDRPVVNETGLSGRFDFEVSEPKRAPRESSKRDFVEFRKLRSMRPLACGEYAAIQPMPSSRNPRPI